MPPSQIAECVFEVTAHKGNISCLELAQKSTQIFATAGSDKQLNIFKFGNKTPVLQLPSHGSTIQSVKFTFNDDMLLAGSVSGSLRIWDLQKANPMATLTGHSGPLTCLDAYFHGYVASGSVDSTVRLWDPRQRNSSLIVYKGHSKTINSVQFSPDGRWLCSAASDRSVRIWDLAAGKQLVSLEEHDGSVLRALFHPEELLLATASVDNTVILWDLETFQPVSKSERMSMLPRKLIFHPNGKCLYSLSDACVAVHQWEPYQLVDFVQEVPWKKAELSTVGFSSNKMTFIEANDALIQVHIVRVDRLRPFDLDRPLPSIVAQGKSNNNNNKLELLEDSVINTSKQQQSKVVSGGSGSGKPAAPVRPTVRTKSGTRRSFMKDRSHTQPEIKIKPDIAIQPPDINEFGTTGYDDESSTDATTEEAFKPRRTLTRSPPPPVALEGVSDDGGGESSSLKSFGRQSSKENLFHRQSSKDRKVSVKSSLTSDNNEVADQSSNDSVFRRDQSPATTAVTSSVSSMLHPVTSSPSLHPGMTSSSSKQIGSLTSPRPVLTPPPRAVSIATIAPTKVSRVAAAPETSGQTLLNKNKQHPLLHRDESAPALLQTGISGNIGAGGDEISGLDRLTMIDTSDFLPVKIRSSSLISGSSDVGDATFRLSGVGGPPDVVWQDIIDPDMVDSVALRNVCFSQSDQMQRIFAHRLQMLSILKSIWHDRGSLAALQYFAVNINDQSILVDLLSVMNQKRNLWSLDACVLLLPKLKLLVQSKHEHYHRLAGDAYRLITRDFGDLILASCRHPSSTIGVDLTQEERKQKCMSCLQELMEMRAYLSKGTSSKALKEVATLLKVFEG